MTRNLDPEVAAAMAPMAEAGGTAVPVHAAPARVGDAAGLPPTYLEVALLDIFRDEVSAYGRPLSRAGVEVELDLHPGVPHEFETIAPEAADSRRTLADRVRVVAAL